MSIHQFIKLNCLNYQAVPSDLQVGKLSKVQMLKEKYFGEDEKDVC